MAPWRRLSGRLAPQSAQVRIRTAYRRAALCGRGDSRDVGGRDTEVSCCPPATAVLRTLLSPLGSADSSHPSGDIGHRGCCSCSVVICQTFAPRYRCLRCHHPQRTDVCAVDTSLRLDQRQAESKKISCSTRPAKRSSATTRSIAEAYAIVWSGNGAQRGAPMICRDLDAPAYSARWRLAS